MPRSFGELFDFSWLTWEAWMAIAVGALAGIGLRFLYVLLRHFDGLGGLIRAALGREEHDPTELQRYKPGALDDEEQQRSSSDFGYFAFVGACGALFLLSENFVPIIWLIIAAHVVALGCIFFAPSFVSLAVMVPRDVDVDASRWERARPVLFNFAMILFLFGGLGPLLGWLEERGLTGVLFPGLLVILWVVVLGGYLWESIQGSRLAETNSELNYAERSLQRHNAWLRAAPILILTAITVGVVLIWL